MSEVVVALIGVAAGALANGGVDTWAAWRDRVRRREVAARTIDGDLLVLDEGIRVVLEAGKWPDWFNWTAPVDAWREVREAFVGEIAAWQWALVDGVYSNLARVAPRARGGALTQADRDVLEPLKQSAAQAHEIVLAHCAPVRELKRMAEEIQKRRSLLAGDEGPSPSRGPPRNIVRRCPR
jgi:hypothetical protein